MNDIIKSRAFLKKLNDLKSIEKIRFFRRKYDVGIGKMDSRGGRNR